MNFWKSFTNPETRVFLAAQSNDFVIIARVVLIGLQRVTNKRRERRTDAFAIATIKSICIATSKLC